MERSRDKKPRKSIVVRRAWCLVLGAKVHSTNQGSWWISLGTRVAGDKSRSGFVSQGNNKSPRQVKARWRGFLPQDTNPELDLSDSRPPSFPNCSTTDKA